ncbi:MAG: PepSY domain-containing protein [Pseudomonadales bacterium]|nr:PepSY domain-containing protein [Pseudomonadales bacterium]
MSDMSSSEHKAGLYRAIWRWHFYAGLYVFAFLVMLAVTGLIMLVSGPLENIQYQDRYFVSPGGTILTPSQQLAAVQEFSPHSDVVVYTPPRAADRSSHFSVLPHGNMGGEHMAHWELPTISVYVDPYTGNVLGELDPNSTLYNWALEIHGTFLMGDIGDYMIEIAAGFAVLLTFSGLYMWWPRGDKSWREALAVPKRMGRGRALWRNLHILIGSWASLVLLFFLLSGLTWTLVWGERFTQAFSSLPGEQFQAPLANETHDSLNMQGHHDMPWGVEQTPLPSSGSQEGLPGIDPGQGISLDSVVAFAYDNGFTNFRVSIPTDATQVWTVAAVTQSGDISDPRQDRIVHIDQETGNILGNILFRDYSILGKVMATSIPVHQGDLGVINLLINAAFCLSFILLAVSGVVMWWQRRPGGNFRLQPPPLPQDQRVWRAAFFAMVLTSLLFPLVAVTLIGLIALDFFLLSRIKFLKVALK